MSDKIVKDKQSLADILARGPQALAKLSKGSPGPTPERRPGWSGTCAIGLQYGTRTFTDTGIKTSGVFGLTGWERPCSEPVVVRCQLAINGKPAPYYWLACANPMHQRDAWLIEHLDSEGRVTHTTPGIRTIEEPIQEPILALPPKKRRKKRSKT